MHVRCIAFAFARFAAFLRERDIFSSWLVQIKFTRETIYCEDVYYVRVRNSRDNGGWRTAMRRTNGLVDRLPDTNTDHCQRVSDLRSEIFDSCVATHQTIAAIGADAVLSFSSPLSTRLFKSASVNNIERLLLDSRVNGLQRCTGEWMTQNFRNI